MGSCWDHGENQNPEQFFMYDGVKSQIFIWASPSGKHGRMIYFLNVLLISEEDPDHLPS